MKRLLLLALLFSLTFASFELRSADITISLNKDNSAHVIETFKFLVKSDISKNLYNNLLTNPDDLARWNAETGIDELRLHTDRTYVNIKNLQIMPQPLKCNPLSNVCTAVLILSYDAYPYENQNDTGVFFIDQYKPRNTRYTLNQKALSFLRDESGNIILDEKTRLIFMLPEHSTIIELNPLTSSISPEDLPVSDISSISWKNTKLVKFKLVFDVKESIVQEINEFFSSIEEYSISTISSPSGVLLIVMLVLPLITYIYLDYKRKRKKKVGK